MMRKIDSRENQERKSREKQLIVGIILIVLLIISTIGFAFMSDEEKSNNQKTVNYNGVKFINNGDNWFAQIKGYTIQTKYNPQETENLSIKISSSINDFYKKPFYYTPSLSNGNYEILKNLNQFVERNQEACLSGENCTGLVKKTCSDNFIIFKESNLSLVYKSNNCIYIEGPNEDHVKLADGVLFKILGIQ
ncbi:MAG TPA: hypothetical protein P5277_02825 [Candidatus Paceibacterota bacterium]|nr:hypothetical protein [Candidatus Paceibacterota bacterium]